MKGKFYTLGYAAGLGIICALLMTGVGQFTQPYREANAQAERMRKILEVLAVPFAAAARAEEMVEIYGKNVQEEKRGGLTFYVFRREDPPAEVQAVAVGFAGTGLWGPIKGLLALESDMRTIRGIAFPEQEETPGLGGEISSKAFRNQFAGKSIQDRDGNPGIRILRDKGTIGPNEVDGITGATMTCNRVEAMLNAVIRKLPQEAIRNGQ